MPPSFNSTELGDNYHLSNNGNDSTGYGSQASPYQTISYAIQQAKAGKTIIVESGDYSESLNITKKRNIQGEGTVNLEENKTSQGIVIEGAKATGTTISGLTIKYPADHGIFVQDTSNITLNNNTITGAVRANPNIAEDKPLELVGVSDSTVSNNQVVNNNSDGAIGLSDDGSFNPGADTPGLALPAENNVIENNYIDNNQKGCGIVVASYDAGEGVLHNRVVGNTVTHGVAGIVIAADTPNSAAIDNLVQGNTSSFNGLPGVIIHSNTPGDVVDGTKIINNSISQDGFFKSPEMGVLGDGSSIMDGIAVIGNVTPPTHTIISNNTITGEEIDIGYSGNATSSTVIANSNTFDTTVGTQTEVVNLD